MYDYIIVGAGAAGCAVAGQLAEDPHIRVLLMEAGPLPDSMWIRIPAGMARVVSSGKFSWSMTAERRNGSGQPMPVLAGRVVGGGSSINGMIYMRSYAAAYESWAELGIGGWGWSDVLEAYRRIERHEEGASPMHGGNGPLHISKLVYHHRSTDAFIKAAAMLGARVTEDLNDGNSVDSVGLVQRNTHRGLRCSSYDAFVRPRLKKGNLEVFTDALARRVLLTDGRATGVEYERGGEVRQVLAGREVVVSCGALLSPHVLQLSGIGPGRRLQETGVPVRVDLPAVGANLQDHGAVWSVAKTVRRGSMNRDLGGFGVYLLGLHYLLTRRGPLTTGATQAVAMIRSRPELAYPDLQMSFRPFTVMTRPDGVFVTQPGNAVSASCCLLRPKSRGEVRLRSPDPQVRPRVDFNFLAYREDEDALVYGLRWLQRCYRAPAFRHLSTGELEPAAASDDAALRAHCEKTIVPGAHPVGTCAMGKAPPDSVVDSRLRVHGVAGLRVADASVIPLAPAGNTNAPSVMVGTRAAEFIRADRRKAAT